MKIDHEIHLLSAQFSPIISPGNDLFTLEILCSLLAVVVKLDYMLYNEVTCTCTLKCRGQTY